MVINPAHLTRASSPISPKFAPNGVAVEFEAGPDTMRVQPGDLDGACRAVPPVHMPVCFLQKLQHW